ncbi:MAG: hypothetical protein JJE55_08185 [Flavobacteriaceae bacterium]|nr:hypothetical protein [Flavobacteriaceae bacterium]
MKEVIKNIQAKLAAVSTLKYVDEDWGQLDYYSQNPPVKWPCALIDITGASFEDRGWDRTTNTHPQTGEAMVSITIANLKLTNTSGRAPQTQKDAGWSIWDLMQEVHEAVQGFRPVPNAGALLRRGMRRTKRDDGVQEYTILYGFGMTDV